MDRHLKHFRSLFCIFISVVLCMGIAPFSAFAVQDDNVHLDDSSIMGLSEAEKDNATNEESSLKSDFGNETLISENDSEEEDKQSLALQKANTTDSSQDLPSEGWTKIDYCEYQLNDQGILTIRPLGNSNHGTLQTLPNEGQTFCNDVFEIKTEGVIEITQEVNAFNRFTFQRYSNVTAIDLSAFNTSGMHNMESMFENCISLTNLDVSSFNTSKVTNMESMFENCRSLTNLDVSSFNTSKVTNMYAMFNNCSSLVSLDLASFDTSEVPNMQSMFENCSSLTNLDVSSFNTSKVTSMRFMFSNCSSLKALDVANFNTSEVTNMQGLFWKCSSLLNVDVSAFKTANVTDMSYMFSECNVLKDVDVSNFVTSKVSSMKQMFFKCSALKNLSVSKFDTSRVTDMSFMFDGCSSLLELDVSKFDTSRVTDMFAMFQYCSSLLELDVSGFKTSHVTNIACMFATCSSLLELDVSSFDTSLVTEMGSLFYNCSSLTSLDLSNFTIASDAYVDGMFTKCPSLRTIALGKGWNDSIGVLSQIAVVSPVGSFTNKWISIDAIEKGPFDGDQLSGAFDPETMSGTWIAQVDVDNAIDIQDSIVSIDDQKYTGEELTPEIVVTYKKMMLVKDVDYTLEYRDNTEIGTATVVINGIGNFTGQKIANFEIVRDDSSVDISAVSVDPIPSQVYTGMPVSPSLVVNDKGKRLMLNVDYKISYLNSTNTGTAYAVLEGMGKYSGKKMISFTIDPANIESTPSIVVSHIENQTHTGASVEPKPVVRFGDAELLEGQDYTLEYRDNTEIGTATVVINGIGNFTGQKIANFEVVRDDSSVDISAVSVDPVSPQAYTGASVEPKPVVRFGDAELLEGQDYTLSYRDNTEIGTATVVINGIGNFTGIITIPFLICGSSEDKPIPGDSKPAGDYENSNASYVSLQPLPDASIVTGTWKASHGKWWFSYDDATKSSSNKSWPIDEWVIINGKYYHFDGQGWMHNKWQKFNNNWYWFGSDGAMKTGWQKIKEKWYYIAEDGIMQTGKKIIDGKVYYLQPGSGAMRSGWNKEGSSWFYYSKSGAMVTGWAKVKNKWYFMNTEGIMQTGKITDQGKTYFLAGSGAMKTGWVKDGSDWYYTNKSGAMVTGWQKVKGKWYYLNPADGKMLTGKQVIDEKTYFLTESGAMKTGWNLEDGSWYYYNKSGAMLTNAWISGKYWVDEDGVMATDSWVDSDKYYVNAKGEWVPNAQH